MNPLRWSAILLGRQPWLPKLAPLIVAIDKALQRVTRGRVSLLMTCGLPELMLVVPGRKSGASRHTPLLYTPHPDGPLVAGSNWGQPVPPAWVFNLRSADFAHVEIKGVSTRVRARELSGPEREEKFAAMLKVWPNYTHYVQRAAPRVIPIFALEPAPEG